MTQYAIQPEPCRAIFASVLAEAGQATADHQAVSASVDAAAAVFSDEKVAPLAAALPALYNSVLSPAMTGAEQQLTNAVAGGSAAVDAFVAGDAQMANTIYASEHEAYATDPVHIADPKQVP